MGFNNDGAEAVAVRLAERRRRRTLRGGGPGPVLGVNIGKTKVVPEDDEAAVLADYRKSAGLLAPYADYLVVNVSSPNTPGLRNLQAVERLAPLLAAVRETADAAVPGRRVPLLVKIAPDLADDDVREVADLATATGLDGIIATNTTISREGLRSAPEKVAAIGAGGLSGRPLTQRSLEVLRLLRGPGRRRPGAGLGRRHHHRRGRSRAPRRRRRPAAGLHRVHLRGAAVGTAGRGGPRESSGMMPR